MSLGLPARTNPVRIKFQRLNRTDVVIDEDFGEPIGGDILQTEIIEFEGQVNLRGGPYKRRSPSLSGDEGATNGHLVLVLEEMIEAGLATGSVGDEVEFVLQKGDRIVQIASQVVGFEIIEIRPESPLDGDFLLVYIGFKQGAEERTGVRQ